MMILVHVTTVQVTFVFFEGQISFLREQGFEVHGVCSAGRTTREVASREGIEMHTVCMPRSITPIRDLRSLWQLVTIFRRLRPTIVHSHTPKGGLLGALAAWIARVPVRCYTMRGLPMMTATGPKRQILRWCEKLTCACVHQAFCVSRSLRNVAVGEKICRSRTIKVLCNGSGNGLDAAMFSGTKEVLKSAARIRAHLGIRGDALVLGFVGRVVKNKGVTELAAAWRVLRDEFPNLHMLVIGPFEPQDPIPAAVSDFFRTDAKVHLVEWALKEDMPAYYTLMDVVVLPTYREGFPNVPLEAAAMEIPVVATCVPGCMDAVADGVTGILVPPRDPAALAEALRMLLEDPDIRWRMGKAGRERVLRDFRPEPIWQALYDEYIRLLSSSPTRLSFPCKPGERVRHRHGRIWRDSSEKLTAIIGLGMLTPLLCSVALLIKLDSRGKVFFRQQRVGKDGRVFWAYKFRTMVQNAERMALGLSVSQNDRRITRVGKFLRTWSQDELPQLINVARGEMSFVGPRPTFKHQVDRYTSFHRRRLEVKPGITGWAQVNGRNSLSWEERIEKDVWYVDHRSLLLDLKIILRTFGTVLKKDGLYGKDGINEDFVGCHLSDATPRADAQASTSTSGRSEKDKCRKPRLGGSIGEGHVRRQWT